MHFASTFVSVLFILFYLGRSIRVPLSILLSSGAGE